jgi:DNA-binding transcriptional LysR family regulator
MYGVKKDMQIRQLRHFLAAIDCGSMTLASNEQNITQPTLSRSIRALEEELGGELFERGHRGVLPTRYGTMLVTHARSIVRGVDQAIEDVGTMRAGGLGHVRLGVGSTALDPRLADTIGRIVLSQDDITVSMDYDVPENQYARLRRGELDAIIDTMRTDLDTGDLSFRPISRIAMVLVARAGHPLLQRDCVERRELARWPWAIFHQANADLFYRRLLQLDDEELNIRVRSSAPSMLRNLLLSGDLIGVINRGEVADCLADGRLQPIRCDLAQIETSLCVITRRRAQASGALRVVLQRIQEGI